jgi:hypothetical protein
MVLLHASWFCGKQLKLARMKTQKYLAYHDVLISVV